MLRSTHMLNLEDLETFVAIARGGSLTRVARSRGVAQTTLGRTVDRLERSLGVQLLNRTPRALRLTAAGESLLARAEELLTSARKTERELVDLGRTPGGAVRVSLCRAYAPIALAQPLASWAAHNPHLRLDVVLEQRWLDPSVEGVDLAVRTGPPMSVTSVATRLTTYQHLLCAAPSYLRGGSAPQSPSDLQAHRLLALRTDRPWTRWPFRNANQLCELDVRATVVVDDLHMLMRLTVDGAGMTVLPSYLAKPELDAGRLRVLLPEWKLPDAPVLALHAPRRKLTAAARGLLAFLERSFQRG